MRRAEAVRHRGIIKGFPLTQVTGLALSLAQGTDDLHRWRRGAAKNMPPMIPDKDLPFQASSTIL